MANFLADDLQNYNSDKKSRTEEFFRYYGKKRAHHQHMQLTMLEQPAKEGLTHLTEIGSFLGYATGLFLAAGFKVRTVDFCSGILGELKTDHVEKNAEAITADDLKGSEIIVCCETLEHLEWDVAVRQIKVFKDSGAKYLLVSVPCKSWYFNLDIAATLTLKSSKFSLKTPQNHKEFVKEGGFGHKWELGYKGYPPSRLHEALEQAGWNVIKTAHEVKNRSMFFLCKAA